MTGKDLLRQLTPPIGWKLARDLARRVKTAREPIVQREVHGITLAMHANHALPSYVASSPAYDTALPAFANFLTKRLSHPLLVLDVGANIGDTACLIAASTGNEKVRFICVEVDERYLPMLHKNTADLDTQIIEAIAGEWTGYAQLVSEPSREWGGTSTLISDPSANTCMIRIDDLRLAHVDIFKTDTDGFELQVFKGAPASLQATTSVFVEFSPPHLRRFGKHDPRELISHLREAGFKRARVYDNRGIPMGQFSGSALDTVCRYVDLREWGYLDLLFSRDEGLLDDFAKMDDERVRSVLLQWHNSRNQ
jgi:FkbM family methyltransferase